MPSLTNTPARRRSFTAAEAGAPRRWWPCICAHKEGWKPETVVGQAGKLGLKVEGGLKNLVESYLRNHQASGNG